MLPAAERLPPEAREHVMDGDYFVVHAPRQTGKTTTITAMAQSLLEEGDYVALRFSCEAAEAMGDDYAATEQALLDAIFAAAENANLPDEFLPPSPWPERSAGYNLRLGLQEWARSCPRPLVLFFDEIDALQGQSLISVLRQLRDGYTARPAPFPHSVMLCGLRDVRDYRAAARGDKTSLGTASPFNILVDSLRIGDFTAHEVELLYGQHTAETGQPFTDDALDRAFSYTQGQPWLVNALAREVIVKMRVQPPEPITAEHVDQAKERLILARATHLDSLVSKLSEPRVRKVMTPLIAGDFPDVDATYSNDVSYMRDLGLISEEGQLRVANPIYREVILRVLGSIADDHIEVDPRKFVLDDGRLDFDLFLREFAAFWRQHGDILSWGDYYHEVAPHLVLMAYLQRVVNGDGTVEREYGIGRGRIDLTVRWPYLDAIGKRHEQREAIELKVRHPGRPDPLKEGLRQLDTYLDRLGLGTGTLVIFDRSDPDAMIGDQVSFSQEQTPTGRTVTLLRA